MAHHSYIGNMGGNNIPSNTGVNSSGGVSYSNLNVNNPNAPYISTSTSNQSLTNQNPPDSVSFGATHSVVSNNNQLWLMGGGLMSGLVGLYGWFRHQKKKNKDTAEGSTAEQGKPATLTTQDKKGSASKALSNGENPDADLKKLDLKPMQESVDRHWGKIALGAVVTVGAGLHLLNARKNNVVKEGSEWGLVKKIGGGIGLAVVTALVEKKTGILASGLKKITLKASNSRSSGSSVSGNSVSGNSISRSGSSSSISTSTVKKEHIDSLKALLTTLSSKCSDETEGFKALFGEAPNNLRVQQEGAANCYNVATYNAILVQPDGLEKLFKANDPAKNVSITGNDNQFWVKFPGHPDPVPVTLDEIAASKLILRRLDPGGAVNDDHWGFHILEAALQKAIKERDPYHNEQKFQSADIPQNLLFGSGNEKEFLVDTIFDEKEGLGRGKLKAETIKKPTELEAFLARFKNQEKIPESEKDDLKNYSFQTKLEVQDIQKLEEVIALASKSPDDFTITCTCKGRKPSENKKIKIVKSKTHAKNFRMEAKETEFISDPNTPDENLKYTQIKFPIKEASQIDEKGETEFVDSLVFDTNNKMNSFLKDLLNKLRNEYDQCTYIFEGDSIDRIFEKVEDMEAMKEEDFKNTTLWATPKALLIGQRVEGFKAFLRNIEPNSHIITAIPRPKLGQNYAVGGHHFTVKVLDNWDQNKGREVIEVTNPVDNGTKGSYNWNQKKPRPMTIHALLDEFDLHMRPLPDADLS